MRGDIWQPRLWCHDRTMAQRLSKPLRTTQTSHSLVTAVSPSAHARLLLGHFFTFLQNVISNGFWTFPILIPLKTPSNQLCNYVNFIEPRLFCMKRECRDGYGILSETRSKQTCPMTERSRSYDAKVSIAINVYCIDKDVI